VQQNIKKGTKVIETIPRFSGSWASKVYFPMVKVKLLCLITNITGNISGAVVAKFHAFLNSIRRR
jgi:hypothetical protein